MKLINVLAAILMISLAFALPSDSDSPINHPINYSTLGNFTTTQSSSFIVLNPLTTPARFYYNASETTNVLDAGGLGGIIKGFTELLDIISISNALSISSATIVATSSLLVGDYDVVLSQPVDGQLYVSADETLFNNPIKLTSDGKLKQRQYLQFLSSSGGTGNENGIRGRDLDADAEEYVIYRGIVPYDIPEEVNLNFKWTPTTTNSDGVDRYVVWKGNWNYMNDSGVIPTYETFSDITDTIPNGEVARTIHITTINTTTKLLGGESIYVTLYRDADEVGDNYTSDVMLESVYLDYVAGKLGGAVA